MNGLLRAVAAVSRAWTGVYTLGLSATLRQERRTELESDLWEQLTLAAAEEQAPVRTACEVLVRVVRGMPADVLWRLQTAPAREMELALAQGSSFGALRPRRGQDSWFGRNGWVVPVALLLVVAGGMWWLMDSSRLSRLTFDVAAPEHLSISDPDWELRARSSSRSGIPVWEEARTVRTFTLTNHADHTALVRIEGLERLPAGFTYVYGLVPSGSTEAHRAFEALSSAYGERLSGARSFDAATAAFETNELRQFSQTYASFFRSGLPDGRNASQPEPRSMSEVWDLHHLWLGGLPETPVCADEHDAAGCVQYIAVPPTAAVDVAVVIGGPVGREEGLILNVKLMLVDLAAP